MRQLALLSLLLPALTRAEVVVDGNLRLVLGEQPAISANLFGITAFEGFPSVVANRDYRERLAAIRPGCVRLSGNLAWFAPKTDDPSWYGTDAAAREFEQTLLYGNRYPIGRFLPVVRQLAAEPMCSLGAPPAYLRYGETHNPADFDRWAKSCTGMVGLWKKFDPALRLVQIWNEPNASWYNDPRAKDHQDGAAGLHIEMANKVATAVKQRYPDVLVGGPVLCWEPAWPANQKGKQPWYTWQEWTLPWLRGTKGTIDYFDFHTYTATAEEFAVQVEMLVAEAQHVQGRRLPVWITESNYNLAADELDDPQAIWSKRVLPYERFLFRGILAQSDKIDGNLYHDLRARRHTLLPRGADDPDPSYWLFWILRDLRGTRLVVNNDDPELPTAATVEDDCVTVVIFNDSDTAKDVPLKLSLPCGYHTGPTIRAIGPSPEGTCTKLELKPNLERSPNKQWGTIPLPAHATVSLNFRMDRFGHPSRQLRVRELFGTPTLQFLKPGQPVQVKLSCPAALPDSVSAVRLGLLGPEGTEQLTATLNGKALSLAATELQDLALPPATVQDENVLELTTEADNPRLAVAFASLIVTETGPVK